jgi:very-short-patch-repair endonuclease
LAGRQKHLISAAQLIDLGFSESTVRGRVAAGRFHRTPFTAVYSLAPPPLDRLGTIKAGALACDHPSLPSHWSAATVLGIAEPPLLPVHVTRPTGNGMRRRLLVIHRSVVPPCDTAGRDGILCTSAARTILDLAALTEPTELERILIAADSLRILNRGRLDELVLASSGRRGIRALRSLLSNDPVLVRNETEVLMLEICRDAGLPRPLVNSQVPVEGGSLEVDLCWPDLRLIVEVDGYRFHGGRERANSDRDREQRLAIGGWQVVRFTRDQIAADPAKCARRLAVIATERRVGEPADQGRRSRSGHRP